MSKDPQILENWIPDLNPNSLIIKSEARVPKYVADYGKENKSYKMF